MVSERKNRDRKTGQYACSFGSCGKVLSRLDHLKRHERTHDSKERLYCDWPGCKQWFIGSDAKSKHRKKHSDLGTGVHFFESATSGTKSNAESALDVVENQSAFSRELSMGKPSSGEAFSNANAEINDEYSKNSTSSSTPMNSDVGIESDNERQRLEAKRRNRNKGQYTCSIVNCGKVLNRLDHLRRHEKSHDPKKKLYCNWPGCEQSFTRSDARSKHLKRHADLSTEVHYLENFHNGAGITDKNRQDQSALNASVLLELEKSPSDDVISNINKDVNENISIVDSSSKFGTNSNGHLGLESDNERQGISTYLSPSNLIELFFLDESLNQNMNHVGGVVGIHPTFSSELQNGYSPLSELEKLFANSPNFPKLVESKHVDNSILDPLKQLIPAISSHPDFGVSQVETFLEVYWNVYHPQYPILHRPSFSTTDCNPLLLLCMVIHGASLTYCLPHLKEEFVNPHQLADQIAEPLRWLIFANPSCKPPANVWIIQCLLLLECYEITSSSRELHERAYIYHGTKIQLLRRSPILGGDPKNEEKEDQINQTNESNSYASKDNMWKRWIGNESMKRATFMAFYLDIIHATIYGHSVILYAHQIHLSLPCEDELWEFNKSGLTASNGLLPQLQTPKFHLALRKILKKQKVETSSFGKKILLGGLLSIMFQMSQKDLRLSNNEWEALQETWKDTISLGIDYWRKEICNDDCCITTNSLYNKSVKIAGGDFDEESDELKLIPTMLRSNDRRCKFSIYHISQIYLRITHYDYIIYAGAPSRMNVPVREEEYLAVTKRVLEWSKNLNGRISVIHAYLFLFEMLLEKGSDDLLYAYDPNLDPFLHRKNIIISAVLVIFAYNYSLYGPESTEEDPMIYREDGYSYLKRIRRAFKKVKGKVNEPYNSLIKTYEKELQNIKNTNHIAGLLSLFYESYRRSNWEIGREYSKLLKNCIERCVGKKNITCNDMYERSISNQRYTD
ncbi:zinc finger protein [[Candida] railenensis]|uniref:Zinc finger protein n=1 Tax=[Candida] railenensis TaxID=45579 RepID=A0A9P0W1X9_9ASCO|nr:zinc finger protein [[Candida] railenensis]